MDVEFIVQYLVLAHSHYYPELTGNGNIALLGLAANADLIGHDMARRAQDAYRHYRRLQHARAGWKASAASAWTTRCASIMHTCRRSGRRYSASPWQAGIAIAGFARGKPRRGGNQPSRAKKTAL